MATAGDFLSEDQFRCCICLDVFTDPVTVPCGHNFCKSCISEHWSINVLCKCPMCKKHFNQRPELHVNTFISEMAAQFRQLGVKKITGCSVQQRARAGEVLCDICTEIKAKALKSCLVCLVSYCETHLEPHQRITGLRRHRLIDPVENLEGRTCKKHDRPLELFCRTDHTYVCGFCAESTHHRHQTVPLKDECEGKKAKLGETEAKIQQMIQERRLKIREFTRSVELGKDDTDRELAASVQVVAKIMQSAEEGLAQLIDTFERKQKTMESRATGFIKELDMEISELTWRSSEMEQLSRTEDHLRFLQSFPSLNTVPPAKDWTAVRVDLSLEGTVRRAVAKLEETLRASMRKVLAAEVKRIRHFAVNVTLDPQTAHPKLSLSADGKQVAHSDVKQNVPDNPERFTSCCGVLGMQSFSSGRYYYEVQVKDKTDWTLGVARESVNRKGEIKVCPRDGYWTVWLRKGNVYNANTSPPVHLLLKSNPQRVGVFVDYEDGVVSFYDVDAEDLVFSFTGCQFTEKLRPYFSPCFNDGGRNSAPLIISSMTHI